LAGVDRACHHVAVTLRVVLPSVLAASVVLVASAIIACGSPNGASSGDEHAVLAIVEPSPGPDASTGTVEISCGRNEEGHYNSDNVIAASSVHDGAHHVHDYVGNLSTDAFSTDASLAASATTCTNGDRSTYYWPVLRLLDGQDGQDGDQHEHGGGDGNDGTIVKPSSVRIMFRGSPVSPVVAMPRFLRASTGDARAVINGPRPFARVQWGCSGESRRLRDQYPQCPAGKQVTRLFEFPSCWNGLTSDSESHRAHIVFPADNGVCQDGFFAVPALRIELAYDLPSGRLFAIDTFPEQHRSARTDHADFINVMTDEQMAHIVTCLNTGQRC
jgi:Domain of unknown function (DUF1996)